MRARTARRERRAGCGYEIEDDGGNIVETGVVRTRNARYVAHPDGADKARDDVGGATGLDVIAQLAARGPVGGNP